MGIPLPPLPPIVADGDYRPGGRSVLDILAEEHRQLRVLCGELADRATTGRRRREVAEVLTATVSRHLSAEEQYLLPAARTAMPDGGSTVDRELAGDAALLHALKELAATDVASPRHPELAGDLARLFDQHVTRVAAVVLPGLREVASEAELIRLGNRVEIAREAAPTRPHPAAPGRAPRNRLVEPLLGVVDKVRDVVTGRRTYPTDLTRD